MTRALGWLLLLYTGWAWVAQPTAAESSPVYLVVIGGLGFLMVVGGRGRSRRSRDPSWQTCSNCRGAGSFPGARGISFQCQTCYGHGGWYLKRRFPTR